MSSVDILVPDLPESVADATVATWHKKPGDAVDRKSTRLNSSHIQKSRMPSSA